MARILDSLNAGNGGGVETLVHFILQLDAGRTILEHRYTSLQSLTIGFTISTHLTKI